MLFIYSYYLKKSSDLLPFDICLLPFDLKRSLLIYR